VHLRSVAGIAISRGPRTSCSRPDGPRNGRRRPLCELDLGWRPGGQSTLRRGGREADAVFGWTGGGETCPARQRFYAAAISRPRQDSLLRSYQRRPCIEQKSIGIIASFLPWGVPVFALDGEI